MQYYNIESFDISDEDKKTLKDFLEQLDKEPDKLADIDYEELNQIFEIAKINPKLQIDIWENLPYDFRNDQNLEIFERVLENKFGEYISGIDKKALVRLLNSSKSNGVIDNDGNILYINESLLKKMNSYLFDNPVVLEIFSFEQLLEIVSINDIESKLTAMLQNRDLREVLISIGKDSQNWQAKLQYLMDLDFVERNYIIDNFGSDGENLIQNELKRREERFIAMEKGYFEDEEYGFIDCDIDPYNILIATFGLTMDEAKELIKKYGTDIDKLDIQTDAEKAIYRKLQIMKELTTKRKFESYEEEIEYYENFYYSHKEELLEISKDVSAFYKIDLEKSFLDLYARQYDRALNVQADKIEDVSYDGKSIPVYEVSGDFMILIRGEQNVSPEKEQNFWNDTQIGVKGLCQSTISQDYIRTVNYESDDICFIASTSCKDGELRMASTTNIESKQANIALSNIGIESSYGNGVVLRVPKEQVNNSRGTNNETDTSRMVYNSETGLLERKSLEYVVYIQETNDTDIEQDPRFKTAQFVASQTGCPILIIPREKCAQREEDKIQDLKDKLLGNKERSQGETDESIIKELIVKFNNNREGILTSKALKEKYFTESEHIELIGVINARLSQLMTENPEQYESLVKNVSKIYEEEIEKYYAFSYDRDDAQKELDIDSTREHLKPYEDFLVEHERNLFDLSNDEKDKIYDVIRNISQTPYYDMNIEHSLSHIQKVVMFSGILAKNENLSPEETQMLLISAAFHDSGRNGSEGENDNHAIASAKQIKEYFENNPDNPFGITSENISIIQAAIEYHEHVEKEKGVTDIEKLNQLSNKYNISYDKFASLVKISELLKDADALDRARFGKKNEYKWSLDAKYLKSETSKSISMLRFSEECNFVFKERESEALSESTVEEIFEDELQEFSRPKLQMSSVKQVTSEVTVAQRKTVIDVLKEIKTKLKNFFEDASR